MPSLQFEALPLVQVDVRLAIDLPGPFPAAIAYRIRDALMPRFADPVQVNNLESAPGALGPDLRIDPFAIGALAFSSSSPFVIAIIQADVLALRWIRTSKAVDYPRFEAMIDHAEWAVSKLAEAVEKPVRPIVAQMRYSNFVLDSELRDETAFA